jgi:hypothetical protein
MWKGQRISRVNLTSFLTKWSLWYGQAMEGMEPCSRYLNQWFPTKSWEEDRRRRNEEGHIGELQMAP